MNVYLTDPNDDKAGFSERKALNDLLDRLARWHIHCDRQSLETLVFSPARSREESWQQRLQWLAISPNAGMFGFYSDGTHDDALPALLYLEETFGVQATADFEAAIRWPETQALSPGPGNRP